MMPTAVSGGETAAPQAPGAENAEALERVVLAGTKVMYDPKVFPTFAEALKGGGPLPQVMATQAVGLLKILMDKSRGAIPKNVLIPAAVALMVEMGDFIVKAGLGKPTQGDMQNAIKLVVGMVAKVFGGAPGGAHGPRPMPAPQGPPAAAQPGLIGA